MLPEKQVESTPYALAVLRASVDHAAYTSPFEATSPAGKLLTLKTVSAGEEMSTRGEMASGLDQETPPSVDLTKTVQI